MAKLSDLLEDEFTDADIQALAAELEAKWRALEVNDAVLFLAVIVAVSLAAWFATLVR